MTPADGVMLADGVLAGMTSLFALVALGSIVPVVPTGAMLSAAAAVAVHRDAFAVIMVIVVGAVAAFLGDVVIYGICRFGGEPMLRKVLPSLVPKRVAGVAGDGQAAGARRDGRTDLARRWLRSRPILTLVVARLIPAGRMPSLLAVTVAGTGWQRVLTGCLAACGVWSVVYAGIGVLGGTVFAQPWQGVLAAVVLVVALSLVASRVRRPSAEAGDSA